MSCPPDAGAQFNAEGAIGGYVLGGVMAGPKGAFVGGVVGGLSGQDQTTIVNNFYNAVVAEIFIEASTEASFDSTTTQSIDILSTESSTDNTLLGCQACLDMRTDIINNQTALLQTAATLGSNNPVDEQISSATSNRWLTDPIANCTMVCKSVAIQNVTQKSYVDYNASVLIESDIVANMQSKIKDKLESEFKEVDTYASGLGTVPKAVLDIFNGPDTNCIITDVTNQISNRITEEFISDLVSRVKVFQLVKVEGKSIWLSGVEQDTHVKSITNMISEMGTFNDMYAGLENKAGVKYESTDEVSEFFDNLLIGLNTSTEIISNSFGSIALALMLVFFIYIIYKMGVSMFGFDAKSLANEISSNQSGGNSSGGGQSWFSKIFKGMAFKVLMFMIIIAALGIIIADQFWDGMPDIAVTISYVGLGVGALWLFYMYVIPLFWWGAKQTAWTTNKTFLKAQSGF